MPNLKAMVFLWSALLLAAVLGAAIAPGGNAAAPPAAQAAPAGNPAMPMHDHAAMLAQSAAGGAEAPAAAPPQQGSWFSRLLETYTPRRLCMNLEADVIWTNVISDGIIAISYFTIPIALIYFVKRRTDLAFNWVFVAFAVFIVACGVTHVFSVIAIWNPLYRLDGVVKVITALASVITAISIWPLLPKAIALPSAAALRVANDNLQLLTNELEERVRHRTGELERLFESEKQARADAERASRLKEEFVATLSHELRTPLNAVLGWTQILRSPTVSETDLAEGLPIIERNARMQVQLIEDLLDMSRILAGKLRLDVRRVELSDVIESATRTVQPSADAKAIRITRVIDPGASAINGDASRLNQVLWNLLANAIKFTPRNGRIEVRLQQVNSHIELSVADTGMGITADFLPHVFERFRQADGSTTRAHSGLGLGLSIVKHLVELHGGTVKVNSAGENQGAAFCVMLPLPVANDDRPRSEEVHPKAEHPVTELQSPSLHALKVLVIDDEPDARTVIKRLLANSGARVSVAGSANEGFQKVQEERPDVIISDIGMPEEDGYTFLKRVRDLPPDRGGLTPAIALTAFARAEDRRKALLSGFQMHVVKPVHPPELIVVVASVAGLVYRREGDANLTIG